MCGRLPNNILAISPVWGMLLGDIWYPPDIRGRKSSYALLCGNIPVLIDGTLLVYIFSTPLPRYVYQF